MKPHPILYLIALLWAYSCDSPQQEAAPGTIAKEVYQQLQEQLITAEPGSTIEIPPAHSNLTVHFLWMVFPTSPFGERE